MKTQLFDSNLKEVPPRPSMNDESLKRLVIENAVEALFGGKWCPFEENERGELLDTLFDEYSEFDDEYELAKKFESCGWKVDRDFVSNLECVTGEINHAFRNSIKAWFDAYQPIQPFEVGDAVSLRCNKVGIIDGVYEYEPATFTVKMSDQSDGDTSRRLIKFEDAVLAN